MTEPIILNKENKTATKVATIAWIVMGILLVIRGLAGLKRGVTYVSAGGYKTGPGTPGQVILVGLVFLIGGGYSLWLLLRKKPIQRPENNARDVT